MYSSEVLPDENETVHERRTFRVTHGLKSQGQMIIDTKKTKNILPYIHTITTSVPAVGCLFVLFHFLPPEQCISVYFTW